MEPVTFGDNHIHTNYSKDSDLTLDAFFNELPNLTKQVRIANISFTDHQTLRAYTWGQAERRMKEFNQTMPIDLRIQLILGVELSLDVGRSERKQHVHFLFYHPARDGGITDCAHALQEGTLGKVMARIAEQNNERMRQMATKAAHIENLTPADIEDVLRIIELEHGPSPEIGREHIKNAFGILFGKSEKQLNTMFGRPYPGCQDSCYVPLSDVGYDVPHEEVLRELRCAYPKAIIALAHPWRYDLAFRHADPDKIKDGALLPVMEFIDQLARNGLINGLEVQGCFKIPRPYFSLGFEELRAQGGKRSFAEQVRRRKGWFGFRDSTYEIAAHEYGLRAVAGNDSHGTKKPGIPLAYGCRPTVPVRYDSGAHRIAVPSGSMGSTTPIK